MCVCVCVCVCVCCVWVVLYHDVWHTLQVDLPVTFSNGEMRLVTFTGEGYGSPDDIITQHPPLPHNLDKQVLVGCGDVAGSV